MVVGEEGGWDGREWVGGGTPSNTPPPLFESLPCELWRPHSAFDCSGLKQTRKSTPPLPTPLFFFFWPNTVTRDYRLLHFSVFQRNLFALFFCFCLPLSVFFLFIFFFTFPETHTRPSLLISLMIPSKGRWSESQYLMEILNIHHSKRMKEELKKREDTGELPCLLLMSVCSSAKVKQTRVFKISP